MCMCAVSVCGRALCYDVGYVNCVVLLFFFFFSSRRRHTRWPRDWSSDVCSSDLLRLYRGAQRLLSLEDQLVAEVAGESERSEERRVGKECRSRWSPDH